jgi:hypothetical protein
MFGANYANVRSFAIIQITKPAKAMHCILKLAGYSFYQILHKPDYNSVVATALKLGGSILIEALVFYQGFLI